MDIPIPRGAIVSIPREGWRSITWLVPDDLWYVAPDMPRWELTAAYLRTLSGQTPVQISAHGKLRVQSSKTGIAAGTVGWFTIVGMRDAGDVPDIWPDMEMFEYIDKFGVMHKIEVDDRNNWERIPRDKARRYRNIKTGEIISRNQYDQRYGRFAGTGLNPGRQARQAAEARSAGLPAPRFRARS